VVGAYGISAHGRSGQWPVVSGQQVFWPLVTDHCQL